MCAHHRLALLALLGGIASASPTQLRGELPQSAERFAAGKGGRKPDLLFIEAAVNDLHNGRTAEEARRGMEGVVATARRLDIEVVMLHIADGPHLADYAAGKTPTVIAAHEAVAAHYAVPSLDLARHIQNEIAAGRMDWKRDFKGNCHVPAFGRKLYAERIGMLLDQALQGPKGQKGQKEPRGERK